jgi:hypothetical protein
MDCEAALYERLKQVAYLVRNNAAGLARRAYHHRQHIELDVSEYVTLSESASYLAFVELGGNRDTPEKFDWKHLENALVTRGTAHMRRDLQEKGSLSHDVFRRNTLRLDGALNECSQWDAWNPRHLEEHQEREQIADTLNRLLPELRQHLSEPDVKLLVWRYIDCLSQKEIADRIDSSVAASGMRIHRARRRAETALGDRWRQRVYDALLACS